LLITLWEGGAARPNQWIELTGERDALASHKRLQRARQLNFHVTKEHLMRNFLPFRVGVIGTLVLFCDAGLTQEKVGQSKHSTLYDSFDPDKLRAKYGKAFVDSGKPYQTGSRRDLLVTPPGDVFTEFHLMGEIPEKQVKEILADLKTELIELAHKSKVKFVQEPSDKVLERPLVIFAFLSGVAWLDLKSVRGYYFTYQEGKFQGAVEIIAACTDPGNPKQWSIYGTVHERQP
jgi:hypothetical protein